ncbi:MAG: sulfatase-like hydrolase/transferase [Myxococcota bacterium]
MNLASPPPEETATTLGGARATALAMLAVMGVNLCAIAAGPMPARGGAHVRLSHYQYEIGHALALGLTAALLVAAWDRFGPKQRPWAGYAVLGAVALAIGIPTLGEDLAGFAQEASPSFGTVLLYAITVGFAFVIAATAFIGQKLARPKLRWIGVAGGVAGLALNHLILKDDYPAAHLFLGFAGATGVAASLTTAPIPSWWWRAKARLPVAIAFVFAAISLLVRPANTVMIEMLKHSGSIVAPYQARTAYGGSDALGVVPKKWEQWFATRLDHPDIKPTKPAWRDETTVVLLVTIDSLRADVMAGGKYDKKLKNLAKLRKDSVIFTEARAPGAQTVYTLAQMFASRYYSQTYWTKRKGIRDLWPHEDEQPRFPELLQKAGVRTMTAPATLWLVNEEGIVRGFDEDVWVKPTKTRYQVSGWQMPRLIEALDKVEGDDPFFGYVHLMDAHYRVSPIKKKGAKKKLIANLVTIDEQLANLREYLETHEIGKRTIVILSSDHGEAFGEHGTHHHRVSIYEELTRVPLWVWTPGIKARRIKTPVSLIDIGPTVLDIFNLPTPGAYMGQTLVPIIRGDKKASRKLTRPILVEGRLKKALYFDDGMKAIVDDRNYTMELYNLKVDPGELNNLIQGDDSPGMARIGVLRQFFEKAQIDRPGYKIPFRP